MNDVNEKGITEVMQYLPMRIQNVIVKMNSQYKSSIKEIRLRSNKPVVIVTEKGCAFLSVLGKISYIMSDNTVILSCDELSDTVKRICGFSLYAHQSEITDGFITLKGGHRVGICGTAVNENGKTISVKDINCINIRIAGEKQGCATEIISNIFTNGLSNIIIAGAPMSGKTTVLRELVRQISDGNAGEYYKCAVMDERCEIAAVNGTEFENNVGINTDVLSNYPKGKGVAQAVRTLSPDMIFCDETSSLDEVKDILNAIMCGVHFAVTVHADSLRDLYKRNVPSRLIGSGLFNYVVMLGTKTNIGKVERIIKVGEKDLENCGNSIACNDMYSFGKSDERKNA